MNQKKPNVWLPLVISVFMVAGMWLGYHMRDAMPGKSFFSFDRRKPVDEVLTLIENKYVDDVKASDLADTAIEAMLEKLDPHSHYIPAKLVEQTNEDIAGGFYGIGIEFNIYDDTLNIINVIKDGPGYKAGLKTGDKILQAGDSVLAGKKRDADDMRSILKGNKGSLLPLKVLRKDKILTFTVLRDIIPVNSVDAGYMMNKTTGYLRLNRFSQKTYREFMETLERLKNSGMQQLLLDLRGNGGGVLDEAVEIADEFLSGDKLITYTEGKHAPRKDYRCRREGQFETGKLVVLVDEGTASASEILIGALQDWDRATIIGRRTFGKGLVQEQYDLSDGSALRLTISRYYTPLGRSIQRSYANGQRAYFEEVTNRFSDTTPYKEPVNARVFTTSGGRKVYGGGGILPDIITGLDTGRLGKIVTRIYVKGIISDFGYRYYVSHPGIENKYKSPSDFMHSFNVIDEPWQYFSTMATKDSIDVKSITVSEKKFLDRSLKLSLARQLWRNEGYFEVMNSDDETVKKAMEELDKR